MTDSLRSRLEALNRGPLPADAAVIEPAKQVVAAVKNAAPFRQPPKLPSPAAPPANSPSPASRVGLLRRGEEIETPFGKHLRIDLPIDQLWQGGANIIAARQEFLRRLAGAAATAVEPTVLLEREFAAFVQALPNRTIALDLETCGLAGSALFLIGLLRQVDGKPIVQLLLARNYSEEPAVLWSLWSIVADHDVLLTFNGKSFDWPMVVQRSVRHRLQVPATRDRWTHIDVLHHARRRYKRQLPNCRLQTLEKFVCRRTREGDIPGRAIPAAYANYVRTGFEREMDEILHHNALDLVTLFDLAHRLAA